MVRVTTMHRLALVAAVASLSVGGFPASVGADEPTPGDLAESVTGEVHDAVGGGSSGGGSGSSGGAQAPAATQPVEAPTDDGDSEGHETSDPREPDHGSASVAEVKVLGEDAVTVGKTYSEVDRSDDSSKGDVTVLAIAGNEIVGAHSDSESGPESDSVDPLSVLCDGSGGSVCIGLLFADTTSTESGSASHSDSSAGLAFACVGGSDTDGQECDGLVGVGLATSRSEIDKNKRSGRMTASSETSAADACVGGRVEGSCEGVGLRVLHARSSSDAPATGQSGSTSRYSCTAELDVLGDGACLVEDPLAIALPPGCPSDPGSLVCIFLNQGEGFVFIGGAGSRQEALHVELLRSEEVPGGSLVELHMGTAETLVHAQPPEEGVEAEVLGVSTGGGGSALAMTGARLADLMAMALVFLTIGALALVLERRRAPRLG